MLRRACAVAREIKAGKALHGGDTHDLRRLGAGVRDRVFERAGVHVHLLDMRQQGLGFLANRDPLRTAVQEFYHELGFELADAPGDRRVIELEPFCRGVNAALPGYLEEDPQVVPFHR